MEPGTEARRDGGTKLFVGAMRHRSKTWEDTFYPIGVSCSLSEFKREVNVIVLVSDLTAVQSAYYLLIYSELLLLVSFVQI